MNDDEHYDVRIHPVSGKLVKGRHVFTPLPGEGAYPAAEDDVIWPAATEQHARPMVEADHEGGYVRAVGRLAAPTADEVERIMKAEPAAADPPLSAVGSAYYEGCAGGDDYVNDCAHFLSNAFILAGYRELI